MLVEPSLPSKQTNQSDSQRKNGPQRETWAGKQRNSTNLSPIWKGLFSIEEIIQTASPMS